MFINEDSWYLARSIAGIKIDRDTTLLSVLYRLLYITQQTLLSKILSIRIFSFSFKKLLVMYMYKTRKRSIDNNNKNIFILNHVVMMKKGIKREKKVR